MANIIAQYTAGRKLSNPKPSISFTFHAKTRINEYGITEIWVENVWQKAKYIELSDKRLIKKRHKYGDRQDSIKYYIRCGYLLTVNEKNHKEPQLITITKQFSGPMRIK